MNESSIFDPQHSQQPQANVKNKPTKGRGVLTFNPLHPSQELPPEQLIRLLGMESKKTRKHMNTVRSPRQQKPQRAIKEDTIQRSPAPPKSHNSSDEQKPQRSENAQKSVYVADGPKAKTRPSPGQAPERKPADREERPEPQQQAGARHPMEYERNQPAVLDQRGPGWLLPALVIGLVAGAVVSASLYWFQSSTVVKQGTATARASSETRARQTPNQQPNNQRATRKPTSGSANNASPPAKATAKAPVRAATTANDANRQKAIISEQNRLRHAAEQRLTERLTKIPVSRELADSPTPPAADSASAAASTLPTTPGGPAADQAAVSASSAVGTGSTPTRAAPVVDIPATETVPASTPAEGLASDRNGELYEESTDSADRFEGDTAPDATPAVEQDNVSHTAPALGVNTTAAFEHSNELNAVADANPASDRETQATQN